MKNNYLYQGNYAEYDEDIGWHDFALRSYDAQLGRFWQPDPYDEYASGYTGMGNDPVNFSDPSGGSVLSSITGSTSIAFNIAVATAAGALVGGIVGMATGDNNGWLKGAGAGLAIGLLGSFDLGSFGSAATATGLNVLNFTVKQSVLEAQQSFIEDKVSQLVGKGDYINAYRSIVDYYQDINKGLTEGKDYYISNVAYDVGSFTTVDNYKIEHRNDVNLLPTTFVGKYPFDDFVSNKTSFGLLARKVLHEFTHVRIFIGKYERIVGKFGSGGENTNVHEAYAYYEMFSNTTLPKMTNAEEKAYALGFRKDYWKLLGSALSKMIDPIRNYINSLFSKHGIK